MFNLFKKKSKDKVKGTESELDAAYIEQYNKAKMMVLKNGLLDGAIELLKNADYGEVSPAIKELQLRTLPHYYKRYKVLQARRTYISRMNARRIERLANCSLNRFAYNYC